MLVFVYLPTFSQHVLTKANALMRSGDAMHKQLVAYVPPGESGMNAGVYGVTDYVMLLGLILTTVLVLVSLISIISAFA